ncbi:MAG: NUDIX hydrolase [Bacteroidota bacterium]
MKPIHPAATVMLARNRGDQFEVLLLRRNKELAFAPGAWVFPGGRIDAHELEAHPEIEQAARYAAVREAKEETNLLVDPNQLTLFRHWTTPAAEKRRFSTWFFFGQVSEVADVTIDDGEIKAYQWIHPQAALDQLKQGSLNMLPPTFISLQLVRKCTSVAEAAALLHRETTVFVEPIMCFQDQQLHLLYKGDAGYLSSDAAVEGPRHRLIIDIAAQKTSFLYRDCSEYPPVNAGDDFFGQ